MPRVKNMGVGFANCGAFCTAYALIRVIIKSAFSRNSFGVMAPYAFYRTALEEKSCSYAGAIVDCEMLNVKYRCRHFSSPLRFSFKPFGSYDIGVLLFL